MRSILTSYRRRRKSWKRQTSSLFLQTSITVSSSSLPEKITKTALSKCEQAQAEQKRVYSPKTSWICTKTTVRSKTGNGAFSAATRPPEGGFACLLLYQTRIKEAIIKITGEGSFGVLRTESGVHVAFHSISLSVARSTRSRNRKPGTNSHIHNDRRRVARSGKRGNVDSAFGSPHWFVSIERKRRAARQQNRVCGSNHASPHGNRCVQSGWAKSGGERRRNVTYSIWIRRKRCRSWRFDCRIGRIRSLTRKWIRNDDHIPLHLIGWLNRQTDRKWRAMREESNV